MTPLVKLGPGWPYETNIYEPPLIGIWPFPLGARLTGAMIEHCRQAGAVPAKLNYADEERVMASTRGSAAISGSSAGRRFWRS